MPTLLANMLVRFALNTTCCANMLGVEKCWPTFLNMFKNVGQHPANICMLARFAVPPTCWSTCWRECWVNTANRANMLARCWQTCWPTCWHGLRPALVVYRLTHVVVIDNGFSGTRNILCL